VSHLVLISAFARWFRADDFPYGMPTDWDLGGVYTGGQFEPDALDQGIDVLAILAPSVAGDPSFRSWWDRAGNLGATPAMARAAFAAAMTVDVRELLDEVQAPTLVIERPAAGVAGWVQQGEYLASRIPDAELLQLPGSDVLHWVGDRAGVLDAIEEFLTGVRGRSGVERVLAAVLFTDIVDSTRRAGELGDERWRDLLDRHDQIVRRQIVRFHGREVNTTGDGFVATFDVPSRAIECAQAIHAALRGSGIEVRAGVHAGELEARGDDIAGVAVHIGARVAARAGAAEVLVSSTVRDLVTGSTFVFEPAGEHELKGVPGVWTLYAVRS
jgi:class 3 adenylate cyclase